MRNTKLKRVFGVLPILMGIASMHKSILQGLNWETAVWSVGIILFGLTFIIEPMRKWRATCLFVAAGGYSFGQHSGDDAFQGLRRIEGVAMLLCAVVCAILAMSMKRGNGSFEI